MRAAMVESSGLMTPWSRQPWRRVLVYGLGLSGQAAVRLLLDWGVRVVAADDQGGAFEDLADHPDLDLVTGGALRELPSGLDGMVVSPGISPRKPLVQAARQLGLPILSEVELAFPFLDGVAVGITGTNGKSTTTELTGAILRAAGVETEVCGNIGRPVTDLARRPWQPKAGKRVFVIEVSSFQLEAVDTFHPRAAALLNLTPDHLDRHASFEAYAEAKRAVFQRQQAGDLGVVPAEDPAVRQAVPEAFQKPRPGDRGPRWRHFSRRSPVADGCYLDGDRVMEVSPGESPVEIFAVSDFSLTGAHNLENAMAAILLARHLGAAPGAVKSALAGFVGLPHRMQQVGFWRGVVFYDDSKGTNVAATSKSLEGLPDGSVHLILGGRAKGDDPAELLDLLRRKARTVYLIGEAADAFRAALQPGVALRMCGTLDRAFNAAVEDARPGEVVLLSPACASYDQFANYSERGRCFQDLVNQRIGGGDGQEAGV